ncbi:hypothetical protein H5410_035403 [Solanum commersonii]|uniref:GRF-type domain-containing protein n=1 Tax=Solanum commersonii TaxID=4109 RepID=A0A9J5Y0K3_SOLCO|nr:hypothetical protein H5410_035403 [Solanum commersonii]
MTVCFCNCGLHAELKMSRTSTNPERMFWGCQKYTNGNGYGFFRWADMADPTYQEQYYMKNQSTNVDHGRHGRHERQGRHGKHRRQGRLSISIDISIVVIVVIWFLSFVFKMY